MLTILRLAENEPVLRAMYGAKEKVTDYTVNQAFTYLSLVNDRDNFQNRVQEIRIKRK